MDVVYAQTKAKRLVNKEKYCVMDLGNHMNITVEHCQVVAQGCQNIWHLYSLILSVMKQSWRCYWQPLFCDFLSFPAASKSLSTNHTTAKKFKYALSIWCSLWGWRKNWHLIQKHKFKHCKYFTELQVHTKIPCLQKLWHAKVLYWSYFFPVHITGLSWATGI